MCNSMGLLLFPLERINMPDGSTNPLANPDFPSNSNKSKTQKPTVNQPPEKKRPDPIVTGKTRQRKPSFWKRFKGVFQNEDSQNVGQYVVWEVLIPAFKDTLYDAVTQGVGRALGVDHPYRRSVIGNGSNNRTDYNRISTGSRINRSPSREISYRARKSHDFNEIILESRGEAEEVLDRLGLYIDEYGFATVDDLYGFVNITGDFVDRQWGWSSLAGARARRVADGYLLELPRTEPVDD